MEHRKTSYFFTVIFLVASLKTSAQWVVDVEGNYVIGIPYNTVRIPASGGTEFDLAEDLEANTTFTFRARVSYVIQKRHVISALAAPLTIKSSGRINNDVVYSGRTFAANTALEATYKFNSYRLTYRYLIIAKDDLKVGVGLTGKIRDANITLENESESADYPDLGFVPLINFYVHWKPTGYWGLLLEGDALASQQGRAEDVFAGVTINLLPQIEVKGGYRLLEGGADTDDIYNFSFVNYAALGLLIHL